MTHVPPAYKVGGRSYPLRYSDLAGKEIIDIDEGVRIGIISETDLIIDCEQGKVRSIVIPTRGRFWGRRELVLPWSGIKKIGVDLIIVDMALVNTYQSDRPLSPHDGPPHRPY